MDKIITIIGSLTIANQLIIEFVKNYVYKEKTTLVAFITAQVITWLAYYFKAFSFDPIAVLVLGLGVGLASTVGFDKVKKVLESLNF